MTLKPKSQGDSANHSLNKILNTDEPISSSIKNMVVSTFSECKLKAADLSVVDGNGNGFGKNDTFKSTCYTLGGVTVNVRDDDFVCIKNYQECFEDNNLLLNEECPVKVAAKFLGSSSSSISGTLLFEANKEYKMTNDSAINVVGFDSSFADGWMKVARNSVVSSYISFNTDPGLDAVVGGLPVNISAWGGICMTYASNVDINVVARKTDVNSTEISVGPFSKTTDNQAKPTCVEWEDKATSLTNIDQIQLKPVSSSSSDPAVIYIKNISTVEKTDVKIELTDEICSAENSGFICDVEGKQIDLSLFGSYTLDKEFSSGYLDLKVSSGSNEYLVFGQENNQMENLNVCSTENPPVTEDYCQEPKKFPALQNPKLKEIQGTGSFKNFHSITFLPKSWYAAPVPSSTSN